MYKTSFKSHVKSCASSNQESRNLGISESSSDIILSSIILVDSEKPKTKTIAQFPIKTIKCQRTQAILQYPEVEDHSLPQCWILAARTSPISPLRRDQSLKESFRNSRRRRTRRSSFSKRSRWRSCCWRSRSSRRQRSRRRPGLSWRLPARSA